MTAAFGAPVPLPGQPGFRAKPSDSMARETAEMEERLSRLKTDLAAEAEMREASGPKVGGARWRSARTDRGSVRAYAKDVKVRHKEQLQQRPPHGIFASGGAAAGAQAQPQAGAGARAAAALRDEQRRRHHHKDRGERADDSADSRASASDQHALVAHPGFKGREVSRWCVGDTLEWLESLGLGKHKGVFQQNEISGPILLEVGLDDLDYMKVFVLAHRKQILKGIEELRRGSGRPSADMPPPPVPAPPVPRECPSNTDTIDSGVGTRGGNVPAMPTVGEDHRRSGPRPPPERMKETHWSHIEPMASSGNQTDGSGGGERILSSNHSNDRFDRAGVRFTSNSSGAPAERPGESHSGEHTPSFRQTPEDGQTPFTGNTGTETDSAVGVSGVPRRAGGKTFLAGSGTTACWTNPFPALSASGNETSMAEGDSQLVELEAELGSPPRFSKAAAIGTGQGSHEAESIPTLDEEAEHEAFRAAVAEWNRGTKPSGNQSDGGRGDAATTSATDQSDCASSTTTRVTAAPAARRTTEMLADELRSQMDAEHRQQAEELEKKKKGLLEGLETARGVRLECGAGEGKNGGGDPGTSGGIGLSCKLGGEPGVGGGGDARDELHTSSEGKEADNDWEEVGDRTISPASSCRSTAFSSSGGETVHAVDGGLEEQSGRDVEIVFMESVLGVDSLADRDGSYLVDEGESDDGHDL